MKIVVFGRNGQVSHELIAQLTKTKHQVRVIDSKEADFKYPEAVEKALSQLNNVDVVINGAAYTAVDQAEDEPDIANAVNHLSVAAIARWCATNDAWLIHYSTDYVFDAKERSRAFVETDPVAPINVYGQTKYDGEAAIIKSGCKHLILRTSWVFAARGHNFFRTMINLAQKHSELSVVDDQIGVPNSANELAAATLHAVEQLNDLGPKVSGVYHLSAQPETTWFHFSKAIFEGLGLNVDVKSTSSDAYPTKATRPMYSVINNEKFCTTFNYQFADWQDALLRVIDIYKKA